MTDPRIEAAVTEWKRQIDKISLEKTGKEAKWTDPEILTNIRNAMGAAIAAADAAAWREIATAPTDSSEVLVWDGDSVSIAGRMGKYWWSDAGYSIDNATHWQPLPAPPASIDALGGWMGETIEPIQKADDPSKPIFGVEKRSPGEMSIRIGHTEHILSCEDAALLGEILTGMANKHISDLGTRKKRVNP